MSEQSIICGRCGHRHPNDRIYDATPCEQCGYLLTAFMTDAAGRRMSEAEYLAPAYSTERLTVAEVVRRFVPRPEQTENSPEERRGTRETSGE